MDFSAEHLFPRPFYRRIVLKTRILVSLESAIITAFNKRPVVLDCRVTSFADVQLNDNVDNFRLCREARFPGPIRGHFPVCPSSGSKFGTIVSAVWVVPLCQLTGTNLTGLISCLR